MPSLGFVVAVSLLVSVAWCGSSDDRRRMLQLQHHHHEQQQQQQHHHHQQQQQHHHHHQQRRQQQQQQRRHLYSQYPPSYITRSPHPHHQPPRLIQIPVLIPTTAPGVSLGRFYTSPTHTLRYVNSPPRDIRYAINPASKTIRRLSQTVLASHNFYPNGYRLPTNPRHSLTNIPASGHDHRFSADLLKRLPYSPQRPRSRTVLKDDPSPSDSQTNYNPNQSPSNNPSFLDPANFKLQDMDLTELQAVVDLIDSHVKVKDNDPSAYTGSRVLVLLLREQCFRLQSSGDPDIEVFCQRFNNRFRSMLF